MKISKQARRDGKALFRSCLVDGRLEDQRVRDIVTQVVATKPRGFLAALIHFQRLVKLDLESRRARVESAVETSPALRAEIEAALRERYGPDLDLSYAVDPDLLGGLRIHVGSDVYDGSVRARLEDLKVSF